MTLLHKSHSIVNFSETEKIIHWITLILGILMIGIGLILVAGTPEGTRKQLTIESGSAFTSEQFIFHNTDTIHIYCDSNIAINCFLLDSQNYERYKMGQDYDYISKKTGDRINLETELPKGNYYLIIERSNDGFTYQLYTCYITMTYWFESQREGQINNGRALITWGVLLPLIFLIGNISRKMVIDFRNSISRIKTSPDFISNHSEIIQIKKILKYFPHFSFQRLRLDLDLYENASTYKIDQLKSQLHEEINTNWHHLVNLDFIDESFKKLSRIISNVENIKLIKEFEQFQQKTNDFIQKLTELEKEVYTDLSNAFRLYRELNEDLNQLEELFVTPFPISLPKLSIKLSTPLKESLLYKKLESILTSINANRNSLRLNFNQAMERIKNFDTPEMWAEGIEFTTCQAIELSPLTELSVKEILTEWKLKFEIKQKLNEMAEHYPRIQIVEFQEILNAPENKIIRVFEDMVAKNQILGRYFNSSKTIAFDKTKLVSAYNKTVFPQKITEISTIVKINEIIAYENQTFRVLNQFAQGGMGILYMIEDIISHKKYVLKQLMVNKYDAGAHGYNTCEEYWLREQSLIQQQSTSPFPNMHLIGAIKNNTENSAEYYLILEFIEGKGLDKWIYQYSGSLTLQEVGFILRNVLYPLAQHLQYTHSIGIIHRDITPKNVMIVESKEDKKTLHPILIDWGVAKEISTEEMYNVPKPFFTDGRTISTGIHSVGNPPEEILGFRPVAATDIYMFGSIFYFICSGGKLPSIPSTKEEYILDLSQINPLLPKKLVLLVKSMSQYEPADRISNMSLVLQQIGDILIELDRINVADTFISNKIQSE